MKHRVFAGLAACLVLVLAPPALAGRHGPPGGGMDGGGFSPPGWMQAGRGQDGQGQDGDMRRLRELRLREAIRNGDLSREEARQQRPSPREYWPYAPGNSAGEGPGAPDNKRRYWRDKRRQANERDRGN
nr:hypothetical protein [uncultured Pseudogulbenkiania sp.]